MPRFYLATCCCANPFGNGNVFVQQEIVFAIALFIMPHTGGQCQNGEQCQHYFFHGFSFSRKKHTAL